MQKIQRKSLLYKSTVEYADYCINHAEGCSHGCKFPCYAMNMKKRCGIIRDYNDWIKPKIVSNALELLDKEIPKLKDKINNETKKDSPIYLKKVSLFAYFVLFPKKRSRYTN